MIMIIKCCPVLDVQDSLEINGSSINYAFSLKRCPGMLAEEEYALMCLVIVPVYCKSLATPNPFFPL